MELLSRALEIRGLPEAHPDLATLYLTLAELCGALDDPEPGQEFAAKGLACLAKVRLGGERWKVLG